MNDNPKETWCRCAAALNPGLPAKSCLQESKAFHKAKPYTFQNRWTIHFEEGIVTEKPFTQESFRKNNLRVDRQNTFPKVREGDTPQGKARVSKLRAKTSRNQIPIVDLGAVLPRRASGCVGCRRRENIIRITGF